MAQDFLNYFARKVDETIEKHQMVSPADRILVAVSGGPDSMCLAVILLDAGYVLETAYFDHLTRDGESTADGEFVERWSAQNGIRFHTEGRDVAGEAQAAGKGFEEYARELRYDFLKRVALAQGCRYVATGHNADDQTETVLMRLLRGTSMRGLRGIEPARFHDGVRVVRPLLGVTRSEILDYLDARGIDYRTDRTNVDTDYTRNRVRHELLPYLRDRFNRGVDDALRRIAELARGENELMEKLAEDAYAECDDGAGAIRRDAYRGLHTALQRRVVMRVCRQYGIECPFERVDDATGFIADGPTGRAFDLGGGVLLRNGRRVTDVVTGAGAGGGRVTERFEAELRVPGSTVVFGKRFEAVELDERPDAPIAEYCGPGRQIFDADTLGVELAVRRRRPGDRFRPLGLGGSKKLKDYFIDTGVPAARREREILLVAKGEIAWVVGRVVSADVAVTDDTRRIIEVRVSDEHER